VLATRPLWFSPDVHDMFRMLLDAKRLIAVLVVIGLTSMSYAEAGEPTDVIPCSPPCKNSDVICTWNNGGNGFGGGTDCQRKCGSPVGNGDACKLSLNKTCYWGWTEAAGWACFSGVPPCDPDGSVIGSAYMTCAELKQDYGGCEGTSDCQSCCSKLCHCRNVDEGKSECLCGKSSVRYEQSSYIV